MRWYILEETTLRLWTVILEIAYLNANISRSGWMDAIMILLFIMLSISLVFVVLLPLFHRGIPERVYPFSKGIGRNLYRFCCAPSGISKLEALPTAQEIEEKSRSPKFSDVICSRCR